MDKKRELTSDSQTPKSESENSSKGVISCIPLSNSVYALPEIPSPCPLYLSKAECIKARNDLVASHFDPIVSLKVPQSEQPIHDVYANKLINSYQKEVLENIAQKAVQIYPGSPTDVCFSYKEFQDTLWLSSRLLMNKRLKVLLKEKLDIVRDPICKVKTKQEFEQTYGPVNLRNEKSKKFLRAYLEFMEKWKDEFATRLSLLKEIGAKMGQKVALNIICTERAQLLELQENILLNKENNQEIYDLNKFTNKTHSEWLLIPRPTQCHSNFFLRQSELSNLTEYQPTSSSFFVDGYWPALVDVQIRQVGKIASDTAETPKDFEDRVIRERFWATFHDRMHTCIYAFPLGISMDKFFSYICDKHKYIVDANFFGSIGKKEAIDALHDVFLVEFLPIHGDRILFPACLRGIIPPFQEIILKVWRRTIFLVKVQYAKVWANEIKDLYQEQFGVTYPCMMWGFDRIHEFVTYCKNIWDKDFGCEIEMILIKNMNEYLLSYKKDVNM